jgi:hypothetical protein
MGGKAGRKKAATVSGMTKISGTVRKNDLEGGMWTLVTSSGETYQLMGNVAGLQDGMTAELSGKVEKGMMGIGMVGAQFTVASIVSK